MSRLHEIMREASDVEWGGNYRWADVPQERWAPHPAIALLPLDRQRYWQQRNEHGTVRFCNVAQSIIQEEVFGHVMGRVVAALDKLERKL